MFDHVKHCVAKLIDLELYIIITTDIWSSDSLDSYLSFTAHWIDKDWEYKEGCLMLNTLTRDTVAKILPVPSCLAWMHGKLMRSYIISAG